LANILEETFSKGFISKALSSLLAVLILVLGTTAVIGVFTGGAL
jgi:fumarate reductase subunit C